MVGISEKRGKEGKGKSRGGRGIDFDIDNDSIMTFENIKTFQFTQCYLDCDFTNDCNFFDIKYLSDEKCFTMFRIEHFFFFVYLSMLILHVFVRKYNIRRKIQYFNFCSIPFSINNNNTQC